MDTVNCKHWSVQYQGGAGNLLTGIFPAILSISFGILGIAYHLVQQHFYLQLYENLNPALRPFISSLQS